MSTLTHSGTETTSITAGDVRQVMAQITEEISAICHAAADLALDFDHDSALVDCSVLALNDVIETIRLQLYLEGEIVREYAYVVAERPLEAHGPPAGCPPIGAAPAGSRVRLVATPNERRPAELVDGWFRRLGWLPSSPLHRPEGVQPETYGTFVSGGYGVERQLLVNPKYDRPARAATVEFTRKEN